GHRIELAEIEGAMTAHPAITNAVAKAFGAGPAKTRLVGFAVCRGPEPGEAAVRDFLAQLLPAPIVTGRLVVLDALPLAAHRKVDRDAVFPPCAEPPAPGATHRADGAAANIGALEARITGAVATTFGLASVRPDESFAGLGATSVDLIRLANALERELGSAPPIEEIFRRPTVRDLVVFYEGYGSDPGPAPANATPTANFALLAEPHARESVPRGEPGLRDLPGRPVLDL